jgi:hypothetical protein
MADSLLFQSKYFKNKARCAEAVKKYLLIIFKALLNETKYIFTANVM